MMTGTGTDTKFSHAAGSKFYVSTGLQSNPFGTIVGLDIQSFDDCLAQGPAFTMFFATWSSLLSSFFLAVHPHPVRPSQKAYMGTDSSADACSIRLILSRSTANGTGRSWSRARTGPGCPVSCRLSQRLGKVYIVTGRLHHGNISGDADA